MRQVRRAAEEIASHRRSGRSAGSVAPAPSATASGAGHHEQIDRSRCESNTVDCRRHRQTLNSAEPTSAMSEHGTFGRFRPLARARPPSGGKISASAALSASACRTPRSARPGSARARTHRPRITAARRAVITGLHLVDRLEAPGYGPTRQRPTRIFIHRCFGVKSSASACRGQGRAPLARRDLGHATCAVASRELCQSRIDANKKPIAESNLSSRVPANVAAQCVIVSSCVHG